MKRKVLIGLCLILSFLIGCSNLGQKSDKIVIWHWMTDRHKSFETLAQKYQEETGIKVIFELYAPSDIYSRKVIAAAQARILPDIYGILDKRPIVAEFIKSGYVADLTEAFQANNNAWERKLFPKALAVNRFEERNVDNIEPGIYGVPIDVTNIQMLYNKKLLSKAGIKRSPRTFEQFIEAAQTLYRQGIPALVSGWGELWMADCFASNYAFNIMGEEKIMATYKGEVPYTDPDWIKVFQVFEQLRDNNALAEGIVTKANKYAEQDFALERAAFSFNGSWSVNVYHEMNPDLDYGVMMPPPINSEFPMKIWGGAGSSFLVNKGSKNKEKAVAFLKWLTAKEQQVFLAKETRNLPSNRYALSSIPRTLSEFAKGMDNTTHPSIWKYNENSLVIEAFDKGLQSIIIGEKTAGQVAAEVQKVKEHQTEKQKKREARQ